MSKPVFIIYVAGLSSRNRELIATFKQVCSEYFPASYQINVVDIVRHPKEAELNKILATPTIVRTSPAPEKRIIGDFSEAGKATQAFNFLTEDLNIVERNGEE